MASFGRKGPQREPGKRLRKKRLKREAKERLRGQEDPLKIRARLRVIAEVAGKALPVYLENVTSGNETWMLEGLIDRFREGFERLREELETPGREITWKDPFLELRFPVFIHPTDGPTPDPDTFTVSEADVSDEAWERFRKGSEDPSRGGPLFRKLFFGVENLGQNALELIAYRTLTGGTALLKQGEDYTPVLVKDPAEQLPESPEERQAAVDAILEERCRPFVLSAPGGEPSLSLTGERDGEPFSCSLVAELHPLTLDADKEEAFYPLLAGLVFEGESPATWSQEDRDTLWKTVQEALDELASRIKTSTTSETGATVPEPRGARVSQVAVEVIRQAPTVARPSSETLRRSVMGRVPVPRDFARDAAGLAFVRGLAGLFSGYSKVPDLDISGAAATAEAERLFWPILEEQLRKAPGLASWDRLEEDGRTVLVLRGLQEQDAKALWKAATRALNKGEGGPGLEVAEPGFERGNRFETKSQAVVVETRLVFWPEASLVNRRGERTAPVRFRTEGAPGYVAMLERHGPRPYFADGWLWLPRGGEREGFRLGGLHTHLFPEGRKALERLAEREKTNLTEKLNRIYREPSLFKTEDAQAAQDLRAAIRRFEDSLRKLSVFEIGPDLLFCVYEAFLRQRDAWANERVALADGREIETRPWRVIRLDAQDLRVRLDPNGAWGQNWRARLFEKLEALTVFERQTRTKSGRRVDVGDRFLTRALDGLRGVQDGDAPETDAGLGLTRLLRQAGAFPADAFFVEVSVDFMARLVTWATDEKGTIRWGLDAARAAQRAALISGHSEKAARLLGEEKRRTVKSQPFFEHSPRLLTVGNLQGWPQTRKSLASVLLQEATPNFVRYRDSKGTSRKRRRKNLLGGDHALELIGGQDFTSCNGSNGYGYRIRTWIDKVGYEKRPGPRGGARAFSDFLADLEGLVSPPVGLRIRLEGRQDGTALDTLKAYRRNPPAAYDLKLRLFLPADLETRLRELLEGAGIDNPDEDTAPLKTGRLDPLDLRLARTRAGLKQGELAERLGVDQALVSRWETGQKPIPPEQEAKLREVLKDHLEAGPV